MDQRTFVSDTLLRLTGASEPTIIDFVLATASSAKSAPSLQDKLVPFLDGSPDDVGAFCRELFARTNPVSSKSAAPPAAKEKDVSSKKKYRLVDMGEDMAGGRKMRVGNVSAVERTGEIAGPRNCADGMWMILRLVGAMRRFPRSCMRKRLRNSRSRLRSVHGWRMGLRRLDPMCPRIWTPRRSRRCSGSEICKNVMNLRNVWLARMIVNPRRLSKIGRDLVRRRVVVLWLMMLLRGRPRCRS